ncbi:MAG: hypothetical protein ABIP51_02335 [Bacteroidia bacterium]
MKRSILILLMAFGINALVAQTNNGVDTQTPAGVNTPATVSNKFKADYPNIGATWQMEDDNYAAYYRDPLTNLDRVLVYDRNANVVRSDYELDYASHPKTISDYYVSNYPREDYKVWSSQEGKSDLVYFSKHKGNTVWFDKDGKYVNHKPEMAHNKNAKKKSTK